MMFIIVKDTPDGVMHVQAVSWPKLGWEREADAKRAISNAAGFSDCYVVPPYDPVLQCARCGEEAWDRQDIRSKDIICTDAVLLRLTPTQEAPSSPTVTMTGPTPIKRHDGELLTHGALHRWLYAMRRPRPGV